MNDSFYLPYPPSLNHYKGRRKNGRDFLKPRAIDYIKQVSGIVYGRDPIKSFCKEIIYVYPPDKRKRDIANLEKIVNDSLQRAGYIEDDFLIDDFRIIRMRKEDGTIDTVPGGRIYVYFEWKS